MVIINTNGFRNEYFGHNNAGFNPADSTNYTFALESYTPSTSSGAAVSKHLSYSHVFTKLAIYTIATGAANITENATLIIRVTTIGVTTSYTVSSLIKFPSGGAQIIVDINIPVSIGSNIYFELQTPAYTTNPTGCWIKAGMS